MKKKLFQKIAAFSVLIGTACSSSAFMLSPSRYSLSNQSNASAVDLKGSMYLGQWREQISSRLNPSYFGDLSRLGSSYISVYNTTSENIIGDYNLTRTFVSVPVFEDYNNFSLLGNGEISFLFSNETVQATSFTIQQISDQYFSGLAQGSRKSSYSPIVEQQFYAPGYVYSSDYNSFGISAVLVQQRFLDNSFGSVTVADTDSYSLSNDESFSRTNKGTGYQLRYSQNLPWGMSLAFGYQSRVHMNEFDLYGQQYSDSGDFDIPKNTSVALNMPIGQSNNLSFSAKNIAYSSIDTNRQTVDSYGYSQQFLNVFNGIFSPIFKLDDLTVYSVSYDKMVHSNLSLNFTVTSRQQAPATAKVLNDILKNDTAALSYKISLSKALIGGEFNLSASYANKPILVGQTDFGRVNRFSAGDHIEGVMSWSVQF